MQRRLSEKGVAALCASLVAMAPVSMALMTPSLPRLATEFAVTPGTVTMTITAYFIGFAVSQLICGPLSDAFGRRPVGLALLGVYVAAALGAALAPTIGLLIVARIMQGVGAAAGWTLSRAIVRDLYVGQAAARVMNLTTLMLGIAPALSPTLGAFILDHLGWRAIFLAMLVYGLGLALTLSLMLPETNTQLDRGSISPLKLISRYRLLLSDARFLRPGLALGLVISTFYTLAAVLPFVLIGQVGLSAGQFGLAMLAQSGSLFLGNLLTRRLLRSHEARRLIPFGLGLAVCGVLALWALVTSAGPSLITVMGPLGIVSFSTALVLPGLWTEPVIPFGAIAGAASALLGTIQMALGVTMTTIVSFFSDPLTALLMVAAPMPFYAALVYFGLAKSAAKATLAAQQPPQTASSPG